MKTLKTIALLGLLTSAYASDIVFDNDSAQLEALGGKRITSFNHPGYIAAMKDLDMEETTAAPITVPTPIPAGWSAFNAWMQANYANSPTVSTQLMQQFTIGMICQQLQQIETTYLSDTAVTNTNFLRQQILLDQIALLKANQQSVTTGFQPGNGPFQYYTQISNFLVNRSVGSTVETVEEKEVSCLECLKKWF